jgi:hypothetical protein
MRDRVRRPPVEIPDNVAAIGAAELLPTFLDGRVI